MQYPEIIEKMKIESVYVYEVLITALLENVGWVR